MDSDNEKVVSKVDRRKVTALENLKLGRQKRIDNLNKKKQKKAKKSLKEEYSYSDSSDSSDYSNSSDSSDSNEEIIIKSKKKKPKVIASNTKVCKSQISSELKGQNNDDINELKGMVYQLALLHKKQNHKKKNKTKKIIQIMPKKEKTKPNDPVLEVLKRKYINF